MQEQQKQLVERLQQAQNILVTVSKNPSVDQLAACIGLTLVLNHLGKHATAVFSGEVPSTLEFLQPEDTLEKNTDSLRDFIIALDKSKADKLRYKVEDQVVRIFITPYRTSITDKDLDFSQGDFNVDVVVALGVHDQQDLDEAITAHGRILHDATVATINNEPNDGLGTINLLDTNASSLSELVVDVTNDLDKKVIDSQIATALLTGVVAATERFRNDRTTPKTMSISASLMSAGANQQLIATQLEVPEEPPHQDEPENEAESQSDSGDEQDAPQKEKHKVEPGTLEIEHSDEPEAHFEPHFDPLPPEPPEPQIQVNEEGQLISEENPLQPDLLMPEIKGVHGVSTDSNPLEYQPPRQDDHNDSAALPEPKELTPNPAYDEVDPDADDVTKPTVNMPVMSHDASYGKPRQQFVPPAPEVPEAVLPEPAEQQPQTFAPQPPVEPQQPAWQPPLPEPQQQPAVPAPQPFQPPQFDIPAITPDETLSEIEAAVGSPHVTANSEGVSAPVPDAGVITTEEARRNVEAALNGLGQDAGGVPAAFNALPLGNELHEAAYQPPASAPLPEPSNPGFSESLPGNSPADQSLDMPVPQNAFPNYQQPAPTPSFETPQAPAYQQPQAPPSAFPAPPQQQGYGQNMNPNAPPPVPPPMLPNIQ